MTEEYLSAEEQIQANYMSSDMFMLSFWCDANAMNTDEDERVIAWRRDQDATMSLSKSLETAETKQDIMDALEAIRSTTLNYRTRSAIEDCVDQYFPEFAMPGAADDFVPGL